MIRSKEFLIGEEWDDVYLLPAVAFKVWWFHYRCEWEDRQSWPGEDTICGKLGIERKALFRARKWLLEHGWLVQTSPAYRGHNPTFRAERGRIPGRGCQAHASPKKGSFSGDAKVSGSRFKVQGSGSASVRVGGHVQGQVEDDARSTPKTKTEPRNPKPKTQTRCASGVSVGRKPRSAKDGTAYPQDFDLWSLEDKLDWSDKHNKRIKPEDTLDDDPDDPNYGNMDLFEEDDPDFGAGSSQPRQNQTPKPEPTPSAAGRHAPDGAPYPCEYDTWVKARQQSWLKMHIPGVCQWADACFEPAAQSLPSNGKNWPACQRCYDKEWAALKARGKQSFDEI